MLWGVSPLEAFAFSVLASSAGLKVSEMAAFVLLYFAAFFLNLHFTVYQFIPNATIIAHKIAGWGLTCCLSPVGRIGPAIAFASSALRTLNSKIARVASVCGLAFCFVLLAAFGAIEPRASFVSAAKGGLAYGGRELAVAFVLFLVSLLDLLCTTKQNSISSKKDVLDKSMLVKAISNVFSLGLMGPPVAPLAAEGSTPSTFTCQLQAALFFISGLLFHGASASSLGFLSAHLALFAMLAAGLDSPCFEDLTALLSKEEPYFWTLVVYIGCVVSTGAVMILFAICGLANVVLYLLVSDNYEEFRVEYTPFGQSARYQPLGFLPSLYAKRHVEKIARLDAKHITVDFTQCMKTDLPFLENYRRFVAEVLRIPFKKFDIVGLEDASFYSEKDYKEMSSFSTASQIIID